MPSWINGLVAVPLHRMNSRTLNPVREARFSDHKATVTELSVTRHGSVAVWGVRPQLAQGVEVTYEGLAAFGRGRVLASGLGEPGAAVVVTSGFPFHEAGTTNTMRLERL